ncbi:hypothetical protein LRS05_11445 [Flavobacterium sp. J372]|uniref:hypothetical protein n=1 Tax=Flavobacterium sp. J372 TaxID=2898436 RepID=UPI0021516815|nr:hypothetical protein [Flavobacterium sp. J372]MCR5862718.1 hypothetical protein [Flavobacterium sp. J372]
MKEEAIKFITEIIKPWEILNQQLAIPLAMTPESNDVTSTANTLAVNIKHLPEFCKGINPNALLAQSKSYQIICDLADTSKHGKLRNQARECILNVSSMFERSKDVKFRFLRNKIIIQHNTFGKIDFMQCALESAVFVASILDIRTDWTPKIFNSSGEFTKEIKLHASRANQITWTGLTLEIVELNEEGEYLNVDINGDVLFTLTSDF